MKPAYDINWRDKHEVGEHALSMISSRLDDLNDFIKEVYTNILWSLSGRQDIYYDRFAKTLIEDRPPEWKVKVISNLLFPQVRLTVAKLAKQPIWDVLPATTEQEDINIANLNKNILTHYWFALGMPEKFIDYITWLATTGNAIAKIGWDSKAGDTVELNPEQRTILQLTTGKTPPKKIQVGEPFIKICSPFSTVWEKGVKLKESSWVGEVQLLDPQSVYRRYGIKAQPKQPKDMLYDLKLFDIHKGVEYGSMPSNKVVVIHFFTKEKMVIIINDKAEFVENNPYSEINYVHTREVPLPGNEYGGSAITQSRPNQALYNGMRSRFLQHAILMGSPKWMVPRGARLQRRAITDEAGEIIEYNYPLRPDQHAPRPLPSYMERLLLSAKEDMHDIAAQHNVSRAQGEPGLRSAKAVLALQDADDIIQGVPLQLIDVSLREIGAKLLRVLRTFVTEDRLIRITGNNRELQVKAFTGSALQGKNVAIPGANYFDVRVASFSAYPLTRIGMEDRIENLIRIGVIHPVQDRSLILSMLSNSDLGSELDRAQPDRTQATEENYRMLNGEPVQAFSIEEAQIHILIHKDFLKPKIHELNQTPEGQKIIQIFMEHIDMHEQLEAKNQARKNMLAVQAQMPVLMAGGFNPQALGR